MRTLRHTAFMLALALFGAAGALRCNATSIGGLGGAKETSDKSDSDSRPTDKGEGLPGYLVDPEDSVAVEVDRDERRVKVTGAAGAVASLGAALDSLVVNAWQVGDDALKALDADVDTAAPLVVTATHAGTIAVREDGSFYGEFPYAAEDPIVLVVGGDPASGSVVFAPRPVADHAPVYVVPTAFGASGSLWLSRAELSLLPTAGEAWDVMKAVADAAMPTPDLADLDERGSVAALAKAYVFARTGESKYRDEVRKACRDVVGTEAGAETLSVGRKLVGYVIAADVVGLDGQDETAFRAWLAEILTKDLGGRTLVSAHEDRPNNWGTHVGATRVAIARYLGDAAELERAANVFKGWLGDRESYAEFDYGADLSWQADEAAPVGINPKGATKDGHTIDGAIPDDMRATGPFSWPPASVDDRGWNALQGAVVQAELLTRGGYPAWTWEDRALQRAAAFLLGLDGFAPEPEDQWVLRLVDYRYGSAVSADGDDAKVGKNMAWTGWTHPR